RRDAAGGPEVWGESSPRRRSESSGHSRVRAGREPADPERIHRNVVHHGAISFPRDIAEAERKLAPDGRVSARYCGEQLLLYGEPRDGVARRHTPCPHDFL